MYTHVSSSGSGREGQSGAHKCCHTVETVYKDTPESKKKKNGSTERKSKR